MGVRLHPTAQLYRWRELRDPKGVSIGANSTVGSWAILDGRRAIQIGRNVNLSSEVALWTLQHDPQSKSFAAKGGPITIKDYAWISYRATILPGGHSRQGRGRRSGCSGSEGRAPE